MNQNFQNQIENTKRDIASFFMTRNYQRKTVILASTTLIILVAVFVTYIDLNPDYQSSSKAVVSVGGIVSVVLLLLIIYFLASEISGIGKIPRNFSQSEQKIRDLLRTPITLYYANKVEVENHYQHYFGPVPIRKEIENQREIEGGIQASGGVAGANVSGKNVTTDKGEVITQYPYMVRLALLAAIDNGDIRFNLEEATIDLSGVDEYNELISRLEQDHYTVLDAELKEKARKQIKRKAAEKFLNVIQNVNTDALIECDFSMEAKEDLWICTFSHPINEYLDNDRRLEVIMRFKKEDVIDDLFFQDRSSRRMVAYGHVRGSINPQDRKSEFELRPIAIF